MTQHERGQWAALDQVLRWINEQEELSIRKTDLYAAVMRMRPQKRLTKKG